MHYLNTVTTLFDNLTNYNISDVEVAREFKFWHVESLLNQAADHLERCISDLELVRNLEAQEAMQKINKYEMEAKVLHSRRRIREHEAHRDNEKAINTSLNYKRTNKAHYLGAKTHAQQAYDTEPTAERGRIVNISDLDFDRNNQEILLLQVKQDNAGRDIRYTEELHEISEEVLKQWKEQSTEGKPLDYGTRSKGILERCYRDFEDAYKRMKAAHIGLKKIFGFTGFPDRDFPDHDLTSHRGYDRIEASLQWVREAISWMVRFSQLDQNLTVTLSLCNHLPDGALDAAIRNKSIIKFKIPDEYFANYKYIRFRGASGFVISDCSCNNPWKVILHLPENAIFSEKNCHDPQDQSDLPLLTLGRVQSRDYSRPPEVVGVKSHTNASPISGESDNGNWQVQIFLPDPCPGSRKTKISLKDLQFEFYLVGHAY